MPAKKKTSSQKKNRGIALWIGLLFVVSAWMFFLGIIVGRGTAPVKFDIEDLKKELAELREKVIRQEQKRYRIRKEDQKNRPNLDFHEVLKNPKGAPDLLPDLNRKSLQKADEKPVSHSKNTVGTRKKDQTPGQRPGFQKDKPDALAQGASGNKRLTIQVISVKDSKTADKVVLKLKKKGYPAYKVAARVKGKGVYYRVRVGAFAGKHGADATLNRLKKENYKPILILK